MTFLSETSCFCAVCAAAQVSRAEQGDTGCNALYYGICTNVQTKEERGQQQTYLLQNRVCERMCHEGR